MTFRSLVPVCIFTQAVINALVLKHENVMDIFLLSDHSHSANYAIRFISFIYVMCKGHKSIPLYEFLYWKFQL